VNVNYLHKTYNCICVISRDFCRVKHPRLAVSEQIYSAVFVYYTTIALQTRDSRLLKKGWQDSTIQECFTAIRCTRRMGNLRLEPTRVTQGHRKSFTISSVPSWMTRMCTVTGEAKGELQDVVLILCGCCGVERR